MKSSLSAICTFTLLLASRAGAQTPPPAPPTDSSPEARTPAATGEAPVKADASAAPSAPEAPPAAPTVTVAPSSDPAPNVAPDATTAPATPAVTATLAPLPAPVAPPVAPPAPAPEHPIAGFDKGFFVQSPDGKFKWIMGARVQTRLTVTSSEDPATHAVTDSANFRLPRVRLHGKGHLFSEDVTYRWQFELGQGYLALRDAYFNFKLHPWFHVRVGQDTKPFSREQITSGFRQQLVDRSIIDLKMGNVGGGDGGTGRDIGVMIHNGFEKAKGVEYAVGVYNGTGINPWLTSGTTVDTTAGTTNTPVTQDPSKPLSTTIPLRFTPQVVARLGYNNGIKGYTFSDLEGGDFRYGIGISGMSDFDLDGDGKSRLRGEVDALVKYQGFSAFGSVFLGSSQAAADWTNRRPELTATLLQAGYVIGGLIEPAVRWSWLEQQAANGDKSTQNEYSFGLNVFFEGHDLKWASDFTILTKDVPAASSETAVDYSFRSQAQIQF